jgi:hypothetical protein
MLGKHDEVLMVAALKLLEFQLFAPGSSSFLLPGLNRYSKRLANS